MYRFVSKKYTYIKGMLILRVFQVSCGMNYYIKESNLL